MPTPLLNRFDHLELKELFADWQMWAIGAKVHADVVGFLSAFPQNMFKFVAGTASRGFPTPRSWVMVSNILIALDYGPHHALGRAASRPHLRCGRRCRWRRILRSPRDCVGAAEARMISSTVSPVAAAHRSRRRKPASRYSLTTSLLYRLRELNEQLLQKDIHERSEDEASAWIGSRRWTAISGSPRRTSRSSPKSTSWASAPLSKPTPADQRPAL
jgi:hypothetical protein